MYVNMTFINVQNLAEADFHQKHNIEYTQLNVLCLKIECSIVKMTDVLRARFNDRIHPLNLFRSK